MSFDEILKTLDNGLLITEFAGLHSGANAITGDFSLAAKGFYIKDRKYQFLIKFSLLLNRNIFLLK